jgi:hypothetical protein
MNWLHTVPIFSKACFWLMSCRISLAALWGTPFRHRSQCLREMASRPRQ